MKIVYLIHSLHNAGGMEKILTSKANWLCNHPGFEVTVINSHLRGRSSFFPVDPKVKVLDVGVNERICARKYIRRLQGMLDDIKPDITISLCGSDVFRLLKCSGTGARVAEYHFLHDKFFRKYPKSPLTARIRTRNLNAALDKYDALVVLSEYDLEYFRGISSHPERVHKIGNTLDVCPSAVSNLARKRFICVGRLSPEKNFADAIRIWKIVSERHPEWKLDIYGDGEDRDKLQTLIEKLELEEVVILRGNSSSVLDEYMDCSGLVVTSKYEGFGLMALEAAASGVPVVAYACPGGLPELISDGKEGFIVPEGGVSAAADRVCRLIEDEELRRTLGRNGSEMAKRYFPDNIMRQWVDLFNSLTDRK